LPGIGGGTDLVPIANTNENARTRVVIVGGGFGGLFAAKALRRVPVEVVVVDKSNHHLFQPLLYQVAMAGLSPADIAHPIRSILSRHPCLEVCLAEVQGIDLASREAVLEDRRLPYDYLILATGARHSYFGHDEWSELALGLKTLDDALRIRRQTLLAFERAEMSRSDAERSEWLTFVVVGGGPTGVELAGSIAEIGQKALTREFDHIDPSSARIVLVEAADRVLPGFDAELSRRARRSLERLRIKRGPGSLECRRPASRRLAARLQPGRRSGRLECRRRPSRSGWARNAIRPEG
jgi:NADH dehydrogenase